MHSTPPAVPAHAPYAIKDRRTGFLVETGFTSRLEAKNHAARLNGRDYPGRFVVAVAS